MKSFAMFFFQNFEENFHVYLFSFLIEVNVFFLFAKPVIFFVLLFETIGRNNRRHIPQSFPKLLIFLFDEVLLVQCFWFFHFYSFFLKSKIMMTFVPKVGCLASCLIEGLFPFLYLDEILQMALINFTI